MEELGLRKTSRLVGSNKNQDSNLIIWLKIDTWYMLSWFWFHTVWPMSPQVRDSEMVGRLWDVQRCLVPAPWKTGLSPACPLFHLDHLELCLALSRCSKKTPHVLKDWIIEWNPLSGSFCVALFPFMRRELDGFATHPAIYLHSTWTTRKSQPLL